MYVLEINYFPKRTLQMVIIQ